MLAFILTGSDHAMSEAKKTVSVQSDQPDDIVRQLAPLREAIDDTDRQLLALLNDRAELVRQVGHVKQGGRRSPVYVASRERDLVSALVRSNPGPFPDGAIGPVFREIISATRSLEDQVRVGYLGPAGTFSHQAALDQFGSQVVLSPFTHLEDVFHATERGETHFGVIPVENTIEGAINPTYDALMESEVTICGEVMAPINQHLMSQSGQEKDVRIVASIPQATGQCRRWLHERMRDVEIQNSSSTAAAAQLASERPEVAAIGSSAAAEVYGLAFVARDIEDRRGNTTRFAVIGSEAPKSSGNDLTSAAFTVRRDQAGALYHLLEPFARHGVNLTAVQSRPMKGRPWEYVFFIDLEGHESEEAVGEALDEAAAYAHSHKILGSYPRAVRPGDRAPGERPTP